MTIVQYMLYTRNMYCGIGTKQVSFNMLFVDLHHCTSTSANISLITECLQIYTIKIVVLGYESDVNLKTRNSDIT